jgi:hypothetical protein
VLLAEGCRKRRSHEPDPSITVAQQQEQRSSSTPEIEVLDWRSPGTLLRIRMQPILRIHCGPANAEEGRVWGTDVYTDDSSVCVAALHSGLVTRERGGSVQIAFLPGSSQYQGTIRNTVTSANFGSFGGSFSFVSGPAPGLVAVPVAQTPQGPNQPDPWAKTARELRGQLEQAHTMHCPPGDTLHNVWGTDVYTDDSSICSAAVHAGRISLTRGGTVEFFMHGPVPLFRGSAQNGVTSSNYGRFDGSFVFDRAALDRIPHAPPGFVMLSWTDNLLAQRASVERTIRVWCPPGGSAGSVWGSGPYTDDSSVCTAAVHAGVITLEGGGGFTAIRSGGRPSYQASEQHGVSSNAFGEFAGSFTVRR